MEAILKEFPEIDCVQLQINYADWDDPNIQSMLCYKTAEKYGKKIIVMEPVKGSLLSDLPDKAKKILKDIHPHWSIASWAVRFAASLPLVDTVLSGMSERKQIKDNMAIFTNFSPIKDFELKALQKVVTCLLVLPQIQCTRCGYCLPQCSSKIPIPDFLQLINLKLKFGSTETLAEQMKSLQEKKSCLPCIRCHKCKQICPQQLPITSYMYSLDEFHRKWKK